MRQWFYNHEKLLSQLNYSSNINFSSISSSNSNVGNNNSSQPSSNQDSENIKQRNRSQAYLLRKKAKKKKKRKQNQMERRKLNESLSSSNPLTENDDGDDDEEYEMHISEEMRQFFEISAKHREERDKVPKSQHHHQKLETDTENNDKSQSNEPPDTELADDTDLIEKPGEARMKEMKELYGKGAAKIYAMETAMQLTFDRNFDQKLPKFWPALPLNLKFD
ncbi:hypothetical protein HELRODRAFT_170439 [Helobdella robusta]|uniref:Uncharacterized protein n=1 Tax=Helobdella robusta TaxID=6412 RepID=T1F326_HELRO|nr:hypothetical protein HELRODRAFT_170439 [Helobdella robusta]ESO07137.1 hypothetical protein HELRODRAFT_170439 [Helobdella robusta]